MVDNFPSDKKVQLDRFNIRVKIPPAEHFFELARFYYGPTFSSYQGLLSVGDVGQPVPEVFRGVEIRELGLSLESRLFHKETQRIVEPGVGDVAHQVVGGVLVLPL